MKRKVVKRVEEARSGEGNERRWRSWLPFEEVVG